MVVSFNSEKILYNCGTLFIWINAPMCLNEAISSKKFSPWVMSRLKSAIKEVNDWALCSYMYVTGKNGLFSESFWSFFYLHVATFAFDMFFTVSIGIFYGSNKFCLRIRKSFRKLDFYRNPIEFGKLEVSVVYIFSKAF